MHANNDPLPMLTVIGSPNFGYRSAERDLEAQCVLITRNPALRQRLHEVYRCACACVSMLEQHAYANDLLHIWHHAEPPLAL